MDATATTDDNPTVVQPEVASPKTTADIMQEVADKIADSHNILIALSGDPSVDEMATAIGLSMFLDRLGKRATAIYSGKTPDALEFLEPGKTFEANPDTLQDFVIAIDKDKADHLRYKLDGDYVKVYITPYKTRIDQDDLNFSYGDYNVDLVLALNVPNGIDLDSALREHGRIMHDASIINITTAKPGKFGEIEWSDTKASSISEMVADLLSSLGNKTKIEPGEATAFLTGIVAATDHFSKPNNTPFTMQIASKLMEAGANQQLITENITNELDNQFFSFSSNTGNPDSEKTDAASLTIEHDGEEPTEASADSKPTESTTLEPLSASSVEPESGSAPEATPSLPTLDSAPEESAPAPVATPSDALLDELKATEASLSGAGAEAVPDNSNQPVSLESIGNEQKSEKVLSPSADFTSAPLAEGTNKYGQMLEEALAEPDITELPSATPITTAVPDIPDASSEINGIPEINYGPLPGDEVLPPPPAPPIDLSSPLPEPALPEAPAPSATSEPSPVAPEPSSAPSPDAFQIPTLPNP